MIRPRTGARLARLRHALEFRQKDLTLVLDNIHDPHNVSAIYRSCDAFGVPRVHLYYTDNVFPALHPKTSASAEKWVESARHGSAEELCRGLKAGGMRIYASGCFPSALALSDCDFTRPSAVILGNEHGGVADELCALADDALYIPMYGMIRSFNVSVAAALILAEASRQRERAGMYGRPAYSESELEVLMEEWALK